MSFPTAWLPPVKGRHRVGMRGVLIVRADWARRSNKIVAPWEHYLQIRTDRKGEVNLVCHWDANGVLTMKNEGGGAAPDDAAATCKQLLDDLEKYVAPAGILAQ